MKEVLVFGGTRFFGQKAGDLLLEKDYKVTIATRGNSSHSFGDKVNHIIVDRSDKNHPGWKEIASKQWEAIFDNICFTKEDARVAIDHLEGKTNYYLLTSTLAVYAGAKEGYQETDFEPQTYVIDSEKEVDYGEGKRQAEAVLTQESSFNLGILRIPIVLDDDDYTERLHYYVEKALNNEEIVLNNPDAKVSFIKGSDAAGVITWMIENQKAEIFNASATDALTVEELMGWIGEGIGTELKVIYRPEETKPSPFSLQHNSYLLPDQVINAGFDLPSLSSWLKPLIKRIGQQKKIEGKNE